MERGRSAATRWLVRLLLLVLVAAALGLAVPKSADASCVGPRIALTKSEATTRADRGRVELLRSQTEVFGDAFFDGCNDTRTGCSAPEPIGTPKKDVELVLVQGERSWTLGTADAGDEATGFAIRWTVTIPDEVRAGKARLEAGGGRLPVRVTAG